MNAAWACLAGLVAFALGYRFYSRFLADRVFDLRNEEAVPSVELNDGIDYVPTPKSVLFGHHYASIAGAAPIIGPAIAVVWGWFPALIWVVLGAVFMGAVHDFSTLVLSMRHGGQSVAQVSAKIIGPRARLLFLLVISFLIVIVIAVFAKAIATLFIGYAGSVIPINFQIIVAVGVGWVCYRRKAKLLGPSILALLALYAVVVVGVKVPLSLAPLVGAANEQTTWVVFLLLYSFIASILPVWMLLQPRDYINAHQLFVGLFALVAGIFVARPVIQAPAIAIAPEDAPSVFPFLFVTIACGAISGFHGLISSGTTSKQIRCATDARFIGYGGMLGEGLLALISTLAVSAGLANWAEHYDSFATAARGGVGAFVEGAATFLVAVGVPRAPAEVVVAVMVISFAATSLDTGVRIQRYILQELGQVYGPRALTNRFVAGAVAVLLPLALYLAGQEGTLWPLFGSTNQLLAGLSLAVVTVWLWRRRSQWIHAGIPAVMVLLVSALALIENLAEYVESGNVLLLILGSAILALEVWVVAEAVMALRRPPEAAGEPTGL